MEDLNIAKAYIKDALNYTQRLHQSAERMTKEIFKKTEVEIAECRNFLNCLEENLPHVRP